MTRPEPVRIVGIGAEGLAGLSPRARAALERADFLAGGRRHLALVGPPRVESLIISSNLVELVERLKNRHPDERCVVLASGDPLFYGIGHRLGQELGYDHIVVEPAVSSLALAFARAGLSWHDASIATVHGRPIKEALMPLLGRSKIGLLTHDGASPSAVARFLIERGLDDYRAFVAERLGADDERSGTYPVIDLVDQEFDPLNVMILLREPEALYASDCSGVIPDAQFAQPEQPPILLTHADVRAVVLGRFRSLPPGPLWDLGAGLGGVAITLRGPCRHERSWRSNDQRHRPRFCVSTDSVSEPTIFELLKTRRLTASKPSPIRPEPSSEVRAAG